MALNVTRILTHDLTIPSAQLQQVFHIFYLLWCSRDQHRLQRNIHTLCLCRCSVDQRGNIASLSFTDDHSGTSPTLPVHVSTDNSGTLSVTGTGGAFLAAASARPRSPDLAGVASLRIRACVRSLVDLVVPDTAGVTSHSARTMAHKSKPVLRPEEIESCLHEGSTIGL